ncbi:MAG: hypothetical protein NZO58_08310 [Gemmataceae bacterium]|nr:hypothetical protein [Gemmataceae bacterium]
MPTTTELAAEYPIHVVCQWIGNSAAIAAKHYLTVREEDYARAAQGGAKSGALAAQKAAHWMQRSDLEEAATNRKPKPKSCHNP